MSNQTIEQERAKFALEVLDSIPNNSTLRKEYGSLARGFGSLIMSNGLGQALAFLLAKDENKHKKAHWYLYKHLSEWLGKRIRDVENDQQFLDWIITQDSFTYRYAREEALEFIIWIRRFAEAKGWTD